MNVDTAWFKAKIAAAKTTQTALAKYIGTNKAAMSLALRGKRRFSPDEISAMCRALRVSESDVLFRLGVDARGAGASEGAVPVIGAVDADLNVTIGTPRGEKTAPRPAGHTGSDLRALRLQTTGSAIDALHNGVVYYYPSDVVDPDALSRLCVVEIKGGGKKCLRVVRRGSGNGTNDLTDLSNKLAETDVILLSASPVVWMKL